MSSFSEFSKHADHQDEPGNKKKDKKVDDIAKNRIDPTTGNEREDREPLNRNFHEANDNPNMRTNERSQNRNEQRTSRL